MEKNKLALMVNLSADECADIANGKQRFVMIGNGYAEHIRRYLKEKKTVRVYFYCSKKGELWCFNRLSSYPVKPIYKSLDKRPSNEDFRNGAKFGGKFGARCNGYVIGFADVNAMVSISYEPQVEEYLSSNDGISFNKITANNLMSYCRSKIKYGDGFALYFRIGKSKGYLYDNPIAPTYFAKPGAKHAFAFIPKNLDYYSLNMEEFDRLVEKYHLKKAPSRYTYVDFDLILDDCSLHSVREI